jgi:superfamily II DNA or RNA helicase
MPSAVTVARPTRIRLRAWQSEALERLVASDRPDFLAVATPGAGKTTFALTAAVQDLADHPGRRLVVVAPTQHLKHQWAAAAERFRLRLEPEWSARDGDLPGDVHGIVTTYQQVATSSRVLARLARGAFVVLDEVHHAADDRAWGSSILEAFEGAARRVSLSGTPFRSDTSAIPFVEYHLDEARADFEYGYGDALADRGVVRPVYFPRIGGFMEWVAPDGEVVAATFDDELSRERANQRLRTALSLEGQWLPTVLDQAHDQLRELRATHPEAAGLVIAIDQEHAQAVAHLLRRRLGATAVVATSDDPEASDHIARFATGDEEWIVAVRMVSEGVDIPRLRIAVFATTTTTELFFRQAVGRVVRWTPGITRQKAFFFLPDDPRLRRFAAEMAESRRHSLRARRDADSAAGDQPDDVPLGDEEQLSLFAVIGAVATDAAATSHGDEHHEDPSPPGVFGRDPDGLDLADASADGEGVELVLLPPPLPGGGVAAGPDEAGGADPRTDRQRRAHLRDRNAEVARELVRVTGWAHAQVATELNRLAGIRRISEATHGQLERRIDEGQRWLRRIT